MLVYCGKALVIENAPEPSEIVWNNLDYKFFFIFKKY